ncbi:tektin-2-like [Brachyhypopomus gauderio]|uniref:tektin-2-like n=1 Tax=Brachyhypopomus gauderio TaxID=698409 RepID=UPI004041935D
MWRAHDLKGGFLKPAPKYTQLDWSNNNQLITSRCELQRTAAGQLSQDLRCVREDASAQIRWATQNTESDLCCRVEELKLWKSEMAESISQVDQEISQLEQVKASAETCLQETSLHRQILGECVALRDGRLGVDLVHDHVEAHLSAEVKLCEHVKHLSQQSILDLLELLRTLKDLRRQLLHDQTDKDKAATLNSQCLMLDPQSPSIGYRYQVSSTANGALTYKQWEAHCKSLKEGAERVITDSSYFRSNTQHKLSELTNALRSQRGATEFSFRKRLDELSRAKDTLEWERQQATDSVDELRVEMQKVESQILISGSEEQLAQARLEVLAQRENCERCLDQPHTSLLQETTCLSSNTFCLRKKLLLSQKTLDTMYRNLFSLEAGLKEKTQSIEIDQKCQEVCSHLTGLHRIPIKATEPEETQAHPVHL